MTAEQQTLSPKRSSIENLMKASRVRNSTMFAREQKNEYDPAKLPVVERPLATTARPLSAQGFTPRGFDPLRKRESPLKPQTPTQIPAHRNSMDSQDATPRGSPSKFDGGYTTNTSKAQTSPLRSSLSRNGRYSQGYDDSSAISSDDERVGEGPPRPLRRHAKSVTFEAKPPIINEYEMITPEPSLASREGSFCEHSDDEDEEDLYEFEGDSMERDDSFDAELEDTAKTPVVLPGDWRQMDPDAAHPLGDDPEDPFNGRDASPPPTARPNSQRLEHSRNHSNTSDTEQRPLPPLPPMSSSPDPRGRRGSDNGLSSAAERASSAHRSLPSPPRIGGASISKSDILNMGRNSMSLEDRLNLMGLQGSREATPTPHDKEDSPKEEEPVKKDSPNTLAVEEPANEDLSAFDEMNIPHISRESILEKVKSRNYDDYEFAEQPSMGSDHNYGDLEMYDPDVPIQSREVSSNFDEEVPEASPEVNTEADEVHGALDLNDIPQFHSAQASPDHDDDDDDSSQEGSVIHHDISGADVDEDDDASHYSGPPSEVEEEKHTLTSTDEDDGPPTPKADDAAAEANDDDMVPKKGHSRVESMPEFGAFGNEEDFHLQLQSYLGKNRGTPVDSAPKLEPDEDFLQRPITPADELEAPKAPGMEGENEPGTPDSVIRHPIEPPLREDSAEVEGPIATIKAPGGSLKTRASATPSDFSTMAATRRKVSGELPPAMPERGQRFSLTPEQEEDEEEEEEEDDDEDVHLSHVSEEQEATTDDETKSEGAQPKRRQSFKMKLDFPVGDIGEDLSFDLDREFDRVVENQKVQPLYPVPPHAPFSAPSAEFGGTQGFHPQNNTANGSYRTQKGYLMRQNTKVVVASSRKFSDEVSVSTAAGPSSGDNTLAPPPTNDRGVVPAPGSRSSSGSKKHRDRSNTWTTEPWNGKTRRRSIRNASNASVTVTDSRPRASVPGGSAPPLPGQESAVSSDGFGDMSMIDEGDENLERGRLFVKVVGVKDLELPLPKSELPRFESELVYGTDVVSQTSVLGSSLRWTTACTVSRLLGSTLLATHLSARSLSWSC